MSGDGMRAARTFLASFLVLFLEIALIRWMPAYIRLLSYFSNFILLASFLGIGVGCLLAPARARCSSGSRWSRRSSSRRCTSSGSRSRFPPSGSIYFSSGTAEKVVVVESTMLLPLLFVVVAALFATLAQRMGREMAQLPPLKAYTINLAGSLAGVVAFGVISWLELSADRLVRVAFAAARAVAGDAGSPVDGMVAPAAPRKVSTAVIVLNLVLLGGVAGARSRHGARRDLVAVLQDHRQPARAPTPSSR